MMLRKPQIHSFFLTALTAQTAPTKEFMFQNVAYWPTVYRTGGQSVYDPTWGEVWKINMLFREGDNRKEMTQI